MDAQELVKQVNVKAFGKIPTYTFDSPKAQRTLTIANGKISVWENEKGIRWNSLYDPEYSIGTVGTSRIYDLDDEVRFISDAFGDGIILRKDGRDNLISTVEANQLKRHRGELVCARVGQSIYFSKEFKEDDAYYGSEILIPAYLYAPKLYKERDIVPVDDPEWLVIMTAAELVRNDIMKQNQYANLVNEGNALMDNMKEANDSSQVSEVVIDWRFRI